jgi:S-adenosylmethionine uptake transporter
MLTDNMKGALLMVASMTAFTLNDICMKSLAGEVPLFQAIFVRGAFTSLLIGTTAVSLGKLTLRLPAREWRLIGLRCAAEAAAAYFFITALFNMPIGALTAILQALPLAVTLAAALLFKDKIGWRRLSAILVGFAGVLLIVRPGGESFTIFSLFGVATVLCATVRDLATKALSPAVPSLTVTFLTAISVGGFGGVMTLGQDWVPMSNWSFALLSLAASLIFAAYFTIIRAMRVGEVAVVAPFRYSGLLVAVVLGYVVFGEWPVPQTLAGSALLVATGIYAFHRERAVGRRAA